MLEDQTGATADSRFAHRIGSALEPPGTKKAWREHTRKGRRTERVVSTQQVFGTCSIDGPAAVDGGPHLGLVVDRKAVRAELLPDQVLRPPEPKVSTPAHTKHLGWYLEFEFRVSTRSCRADSQTAARGLCLSISRQLGGDLKAAGLRV